MKKSSTLFEPIGRETRNKLSEIVKETLAKDFSEVRVKQFTAAELWNIQRKANSSMHRWSAL
jgi:hypothetical protein